MTESSGISRIPFPGGALGILERLWDGSCGESVDTPPTFLTPESGLEKWWRHFTNSLMAFPGGEASQESVPPVTDCHQEKDHMAAAVASLSVAISGRWE